MMTMTARSDRLHHAALLRDRPAILRALYAGENPNAKDSQGRSALVCAITGDCSTCRHVPAHARLNVALRTLLDHGAVPDAIDIRSAPESWRDEFTMAAIRASFPGRQHHACASSP